MQQAGPNPNPTVSHPSAVISPYPGHHPYYTQQEGLLRQASFLGFMEGFDLLCTHTASCAQMFPDVPSQNMIRVHVTAALMWR